jgi:hypothetical protein
MNYRSASEFREIMTQFLELERKQDELSRNSRRFGGIRLGWQQGGTLCVFRAQIPLYKACTAGAKILLSRGDASCEGVVFKRSRRLELHVKFAKPPPFAGQAAAFRSSSL